MQQMKSSYFITCIAPLRKLNSREFLVVHSQGLVPFFLALLTSFEIISKFSQDLTRSHQFPRINSQYSFPFSPNHLHLSVPPVLPILELTPVYTILLADISGISFLVKLKQPPAHFISYDSTYSAITIWQHREQDVEYR